MAKRILLIDDDPVIRTLISECLSCFGHNVHSAASGAEGLAQLKAERPDAIIVDFQMPEMSGLEVLTHIRANPDTNTVPVLMLSANIDDKVLKNNPSVQANHYLQKPFELKELIGMIERL